MNKYYLIGASALIATILCAGAAYAPVFPVVSGSPADGSELPAAKTASEKKEIVLLFGGDAMLSRVVGSKTVSSGDWSWPFAHISSTLAAADLTIINLESPFAIGGNHKVPTGSFSFNADPMMARGLISAGVDIVSLANNHMMNQGTKGITDTETVLKENNIDFAGAGLTEAEARKPVIRSVDGKRFGFLAYAYPDDYQTAAAAKAGTANLDIGKMRADIAALKPQVDVVIILMHAGTEYTEKPNAQQTAFAHAAIDAGADLIVGHHPHWVQKVEKYNGKTIIYSLGNLVFDQMWSVETTEGALAKVGFVDGKISGISYVPIIIKNYGQPEIAKDAKQTEKIFQRMDLIEED